MGGCLSFHPCVGFKVKQPGSVQTTPEHALLCVRGARAEGGPWLEGWTWETSPLLGELQSLRLSLAASLCINVSLSFFLSCCVPSPSVSPHSILPHTPCSAWLVSVPLHLCLDACVGAAVGGVGYSSLSLHLLTLSLPSLVPEAPSSVCGGVFAGVCVCVFSFLGIFLPLSPSRCPPHLNLFPFLSLLSSLCWLPLSLPHSSLLGLAPSLYAPTPHLLLIHLQRNPESLRGQGLHVSGKNRP